MHLASHASTFNYNMDIQCGLTGLLGHEYAPSELLRLRNFFIQLMSKIVFTTRSNYDIVFITK